MEIIKTLFNRYKHFSIQLIYIPLLLWFSYIERTNIPKYVMHCSLDDKIPFIKEFIVAYYFWFAFMAFTFIYLGTVSKKDYYKFVILIALNLIVSNIIYIVFPNVQHMRPHITSSDPFSFVVNYIYSTDTPTDVFPSIHVAHSVGAYLALISCDNFKDKRIYRILAFISMILISISTVFVKQHSAINLLGGFVMVSILYLCVYKLPKLFESTAPSYEVKDEHLSM